jgi:hypothetical protein
VDVLDYLEDVARFPPAEIEAMRGGRAIVKTAAPEEGALAILGAVRIRTTKEHVRLYFDELMKFEDGEVVLRTGRFGDPPAPADVARLDLPEGDIDALRGCRPGDCPVQVGAGLADLQAAIDWRAKDHREQVNRFVRQRLVDYVKAYRERGDDALVTYVGGAKPVSLAREWQALLAAAPYLHGYAPGLRRYLAEYPKAALEGGRDLVQWSTTVYGRKPIVAVTHVVLYQDEARPDRLSIALKQIYASRSSEGAFSFATVVETADSEGKKTAWVVFVNRTRTDALRGGLSGVKRKVALGEVLKATELTLRQMQEGLEKAAGVLQ